MRPAEVLQRRDVVVSIVGPQAGQGHLAGVDDQERQQIDGAGPGVLELLPLDRTGDGPADRVPFEHLLVGHLVGADDPDAPPGQPLSVGIAPEHLLGPLLEPGIEPGGPPVAGPVRLEIDRIQDPADGAGADRRDDPVEDSLAGQVLTGPVGNVQAPGHRLQAGQGDDLRPMEGGKSARGVPNGPRGPATRSGHAARSDGRSSRRWTRRTAPGRRLCWSARLGRWPAQCEPDGPATRVRSRCGRSVEGRADPPGGWRAGVAFVLSSDHSSRWMISDPSVTGVPNSLHDLWPGTLGCSNHFAYFL